MSFTVEFTVTAEIKGSFIFFYLKSEICDTSFRIKISDININNDINDDKNFRLKPIQYLEPLKKAIENANKLNYTDILNECNQNENSLLHILPKDIINDILNDINTPIEIINNKIKMICKSLISKKYRYVWQFIYSNKSICNMSIDISDCIEENYNNGNFQFKIFDYNYDLYQMIRYNQYGILKLRRIKCGEEYIEKLDY